MEMPIEKGMSEDMLAVCCASRIKSKKSPLGGFYRANCYRTKGSQEPDNRDFGGTKYRKNPQV
jgi:hypothetical protein